ncbi:hypothetical protein C8F01DRAFT_1367586 [Mycena amicta]|nr:hypothetical protein C8F01DRAFT_1367586 [Mycena amicta]
MLARTLLISVFTAASVVLATECPVCPTTDLVGDALVAASGGTRGTPRFCGYSPDASGASGPSVDCFYNDSDGSGTGPSECPASTVIEDVC